MFRKLLSCFCLTLSFCVASDHGLVDWLTEEHIPVPSDSLLLRPTSLDANKRFEIITVCGTKGVGKTSTLEKLKAGLEKSGYFVQTHAIFAKMNERFASESGSFGKFTQSKDGALEAEEALREFNKAIIFDFIHGFEGASESKGVLLMDRGWLTVLTSLDDAHKDLSSDDKQILWYAYWVDRIYPTVFIETKPENTLVRRAGKLDLMSGLPCEESVFHDYQRRVQLVKRFNDYIFAHFKTPEVVTGELITGIANDIQEKIEQSFV